MPILAMGEVAKIRGRKFTKTRATDGCSGCHFHERNQACPGDSTMSALENGGSDCVGAVWKLSPEPPAPTKPNPAAVKPTAPKAEPSLYKAIRGRLDTKDRETLHARTQKAVEAVEALLEGVQSVEDRTIQNPAPAVPWILEGLVVDPGEEAVGQWGFFCDMLTVDALVFGEYSCAGEGIRKYHARGGADWRHFISIPNFPGKDLLSVIRNPRTQRGQA